VRDGHAVRPYVRVRMPAFGKERARRYAAWFAEVDAAAVVDTEPPFSADAVELGRKLAGTGARNITNENISLKHYMNVTWVSRPIPEDRPSDEELFGEFYDSEIF
jgi:sulfoacetaldehyde dehydrogenase